MASPKKKPPQKKSTGLSFTKMHSNGNDFMVVDNRSRKWRVDPGEMATQIKIMGDRKRGVGFDQLMLIEPGEDSTHPILQIFNTDGNKAEACGNGTRAAGQYIMDKLSCDEICFHGPIRHLEVWRKPNISNHVWVAMGKVSFLWQDIPLKAEANSLALDLKLDARTPFATLCDAPIAVNIGNPHCVFFCADAEQADPENEGKFLENHPFFPQKSNIEFVSVRPDGSLRMRVWERDVGVTQACGSGACAAFAAAKKIGKITTDQAEIHLDGGSVSVAWQRENAPIILSGDVHYVYHGDWLFRGAS